MDTNTPKLFWKSSTEQFQKAHIISIFQNYQVGAKQVKIITDHKPLRSIFNTHTQGLIWTERIKLHQQDIKYYVEYQQGKMNQSHYLLRNGKPFSTLPENEQMEAVELHNLFTHYRLHKLQTN